jgi:hypothetical protein
MLNKKRKNVETDYFTHLIPKILASVSKNNFNNYKPLTKLFKYQY